MARELSPTLEAQQQWGLITRPYLSVHIAHKWGGVIRYEFGKIYDSEGTQRPHCATIPGDGSLNRIRLVQQGTPCPATQVLRPMGPGVDTGLAGQHPDSTFHWDKCDEVTPDEDSTYVWEDGQFWLDDLYELTNPTTGTGIITKVIPTIRCREIGGTPHAEAIALIWTHDGPHAGSAETLSASYQNFTKEWTLNPSTSQPWTWQELIDLQAGPMLNAYEENKARCTQLEVTVEATPITEYRIDHQRVADPIPASDFTNWNDLGLGNVKAAAIISHGSEVLILYNLAADNHIRYIASNDNGQNFGAPQDIGEITHETTLTVDNFDAGYNTSGDVIVAWCIDTGEAFGYELDYFYRYSGEWGALQGFLLIKPICHALTICFGTAWCSITSVEDDEGVKSLLTCPIPRVIAQMDEVISRSSTDPYTYGKPFLRYTDNYRLYLLEKFTQAELQDRIWYSHTPAGAAFNANAWLEPIPLDIEDDFGMCLSQGGDYVWLTSATKVYRALATTQDLDITSRILEVDLRQYPDIRKGSLAIVLDNTDGYFNSFNRLGGEITIGIGYATSAGYESSLASSFWITKQKLIAPPWYPLRMIYPVGVIGTLRLETEDVWRFLYRLRVRRHLEWAEGAKTVKQLLTWFFGRAGLTLDEISSSGAVNNFKPAFEVRVGTSYRTVIKNLMKMIPDQVFFRENKAYLRNPTTAEEEDWTYHTLLGNNLLVYRGKYGTSAWDPNRAEVWTDTEMKMKADWDQIGTFRDRLSRVTTPTYPNLSRAEERADAELRRAEVLTGEDSWMTAPVNCGLEPWDKLKITDLNAGVENIYRRVIRLKTYWNARHWHYSQVMILGAD